MIAVIGAFGRAHSGHHFFTEVGVGHDAEFAGTGNEERGDMLLRSSNWRLLGSFVPDGRAPAAPL